MSSLKIRAAVVREVNAPWKIEEIDLENPREDEILVKMVGTGICHTDTACRQGFPVPMPIVLGHEGAGIVEAIGSDVKNINVGDHVLLSYDYCETCHNCENHAPAYCYDFFPRNLSGGRPVDHSTPFSQDGQPISGVFFGQSSFASHAIAREANAVVVDKKLPLEIMGPLGCGIQTGAGAIINSLQVKEGDSVAIFGAGAVGLSAVMGAKVVGAKEIIVVELNEKRRQLALELGATQVIDPIETPDVLNVIIENSGGVNYAFDTTGLPAVIEVAVSVLLTGGMLGMVGAPREGNDSLPEHFLSLLARGVGLRYIIEGDSISKEFIPKMIKWYQEGNFPFDRLVEKYPFNKINEAAEAAESGAVIKPVLIFD